VGTRWLTIHQVAVRAQTTERTVRRDIASGVLRSRKLNDGSRRIATSIAERYRCVRELDEPHMKVEAFAARVGLSLRTVRRLIAAGDIGVVRVSPRRQYIFEAEILKSEALRLMAESVRLKAEALAEEQQRPTKAPSAVDNAKPVVSDRLSSRRLFSVREIAALSGRSPREIHYHFSKGLLPWSIQSCPRGKLLFEAEIVDAYVRLLRLKA
jgi:AraC-like DNA-binding protein